MTTVWIPGAEKTCGTKYSAWLVKYGLHVAAVYCRARGFVNLSDIIECALEDDLLRGFDRRGDPWARQVFQRGFFVRASDGSCYVAADGVDLDDIKFPGKPPRRFENTDGSYAHESQPIENATPGDVHRLTTQLMSARLIAQRASKQ